MKNTYSLKFILAHIGCHSHLVITFDLLPDLLEAVNHRDRWNGVNA